MEAKIIFNGKVYASPEAMPEEARQAYEQAVAQLADANQNSIPDILERGAAGNVIAIQQSSITVNGREYKSVGDMPAIVRRLFELAMSQADANRNGIPDALEPILSGSETASPSAGIMSRGFSWAGNPSTLKQPQLREQSMKILDQTTHTLEGFLRVLLGIVAVATVAGAIFLMVKMDSGSRSQGGRFYVAIAALVVLGAVDSQFRKLVKRNLPFSLTTTEAESRYNLVSLLLMLIAAVMLISLAWVLP